MGWMDDYYSVDPRGDANIREELVELYCGSCDNETEICVEMEYSYGARSYSVKWTCPICGSENEDEGDEDYDFTAADE